MLKWWYMALSLRYNAALFQEGVDSSNLCIHLHILANGEELWEDALEGMQE